MDVLCKQSFPFQLSAQLFGRKFCGTEYYDTFKVPVLQQVDHQRQFLGFINHVCYLKHIFGRFRYRYADFHRVVQNLFGKRPDLARHGGCKHEILPLPRYVLDDLHNIIIKSHIQHPVCFIQHEKFQAGKIYIRTVQVCDHSSGSTDDNFSSFCQSFFLSCKQLAIASSIYGYGSHIGKIRETLHVLINLHGKLPGGNNDQRTRRIGHPVRNNMLDHGEQKCSRFSCSGLRRSNHIVPLKNGRHGLLLDWCGRFKSHGFDPFHQRRIETEFTKIQKYLSNG